jgi:hypothetical protein
MFYEEFLLRSRDIHLAIEAPKGAEMSEQHEMHGGGECRHAVTAGYECGVLIRMKTKENPDV